MWLRVSDEDNSFYVEDKLLPKQMESVVMTFGPLSTTLGHLVYNLGFYLQCSGIKKPASSTTRNKLHLVSGLYKRHKYLVGKVRWIDIATNNSLWNLVTFSTPRGDCNGIRTSILTENNPQIITRYVVKEVGKIVYRDKADPLMVGNQTFKEWLIGSL